jgi:hypothetical protein
MEKLVYVVWRRPETTPLEFREQVCGAVAKRLADAGAERIGASLVDDAVEEKLGQRLTRLDPPIDGIVSFWLERIGIPKGVSDVREPPL